jgi:hypothetical protein
MKRYTLRGLIHAAKIFNQLRLDRRTKKDRRRELSDFTRPRGDAYESGRMERHILVGGVLARRLT